MVRPLPYILQRHRYALGIAPDALIDIEAVDCITALNIQDTLDVVSCSTTETAIAVRSHWSPHHAYGEWHLHHLHHMHSRIAHYDTMSYTVYHHVIELDGISYVVWRNIHTRHYRVWILY